MSLTAYLGIASGVALVLTGLGIVAARPRQAAGWFFAGFVGVWGVEFVLFNSLRLLDDISTILLVERAAFAFVLVEVLLLVHFTVRFTGGLGTRTEWWSWGAAAFGLVVAGILAVDPSLFSRPSGSTTLATVLIFVPSFVVLYVTLWILARRHRQGLLENEHREHRIVLAGLALYAAYTAGFYLSLYGVAMIRDPAGSSTSVRILLALFAGATAFLLVLAARYRLVDDPPEVWGPRERDIVSAVVLGPLLLGAATGLPDSVGPPRLDLFGLLRIGSALVIAYGLLKFEIFGIDRKVKTGIRGSLVAAVFVLVFFAISESVEFLVSETVGTGAGLAAAGLLTLAFRPIEGAASDVADRIMPGVDDSEDYEERRTREIYQAAVERAAGDEVLTEREKRILGGLREDLDLADDEARSVEEKVLSRPLAA